jgi:LemA protein
MFAMVAVLGLVFGAVVIVGGMYNGLVTARNDFRKAFAQIDVQLKRRHDLIPNLVETAKGYMKHESETLEAVIQARNMAVAAGKSVSRDPTDAGAMAGLLGAESLLTGALGKLFALSEAYPDLKANQNMLQLSEELADTEDLVSGARQKFNRAATAYNNRRERFPTNIIAGMFNFGPAMLFKVEEPAEREAPKVTFG